MLPDDPEHIFMICGNSASRSSVYTTHVDYDQSVRENARNIVSDGHGLIRLVSERRNSDD
jgi:hypothetical protein